MFDNINTQKSHLYFMAPEIRKACENKLNDIDLALLQCNFSRPDIFSFGLIMACVIDYI